VRSAIEMDKYNTIQQTKTLFANRDKRGHPRRL